MRVVKPRLGYSRGPKLLVHIRSEGGTSRCHLRANPNSRFYQLGAIQVYVSPSVDPKDHLPMRVSPSWRGGPFPGPIFLLSPVAIRTLPIPSSQ